VIPHWSQCLSLLALVLVANAAPALLALLRGVGALALDGGLVLGDGRPLLGPSKTWRGLGAALAATPLAALALGLAWHLGLVVALGAMAGDLLASFAKRRLGLKSSASAPLLDQLPESLIPALLVHWTLGLDWLDLAVVVGAFTALDLVLTPLGRRLSAVRNKSELS
jgi:CDP-diglyceride synthetase